MKISIFYGKDLLKKLKTENETKQQKRGFLGMLLGTLGASLLGNILAGGVLKASYDNKEGRGILNHPHHPFLCFLKVN